MEKASILNHKSKLELDLKNGAQIEKLELETESGKLISVVSKFDKTKDFFLTGNFLMFPWVNRLEKDIIKFNNQNIFLNPKKKDQNGFLIHGNFFDKKREIINLKNKFLSIKPILYQENFPIFRENYFLEKNFCEFEIEFFNSSDIEQIFAFGYHPYLSLNQKIDLLNFKTNLNQIIGLNSNLLPDFNLKIENPIQDKTSLNNINLDNLFTSTEKIIYFCLENSEVGLKISFEKKYYQFVQIYTPEDRLSIAVEPISSTGNVFFEPNSKSVLLQPKEKISASFKIEVYDINA